jgi:pSer/pThr/pTyr-binding forkhead associated (FHA) protein
MKLSLRVLSGLNAGDERSMKPPGGFIGRGEGCAVHLRDVSVSRTHLELRYQQNGWWAYQHSASSPSRVNGVPVGSSPMALYDRGILQLGSISIEYLQEQATAAATQSESPPTLINVRRVLPAIQHSVLPQMTPIRAADPPQSDTPATLILRRPPALEPKEAPPTLIRRLPAEDKSAPPPASNSQTLPIHEPTEDVDLDLTQLESERDQLRVECEKLRLERDKLAADRLQLSQENAKLREDAAHKPSAPQAPSSLAAHALSLLRPFSENLEQTSAALQAGDTARARSLLREVSFGLADFRDLFETSR